MTLRTWLLFVGTEAVLCLTPGPAVLLVVSSGLRGGVRNGIWASLGILAANAMYFAISATSLGAVIAASPWLYVAVKWAGAGYLIYLGLRDVIRPGGVIGDGPAASGSRKSFGRGFVLQSANPKAIVFFVALLPQFLNPAESIPWQVAILGASSIVVEFFILLGYSALSGKASHLVRRPGYAKVTNRIGGALLILAGAGIATMSRS